MHNTLCQKLSIIVPAHNEEKYLPLCLASIKVAAQRISCPTEIIVVLNRCTDRTEEIALRLGCKIVRNDQKNLSVIRNAGVQAAEGDIVITIDADSRMSPNMLKKVIKLMITNKSVGGGVNIIPERISLGIFVSMLCLLPVALFYRIGAGMFFFRREDFIKIGGFNENMYSAEDIDFAVRLKKFGKKQGRSFRVILLDYIITSCRKFDTFGDWYFVKHPIDMLRLLFGKDRVLANKIWYDFKH